MWFRSDLGTLALCCHLVSRPLLTGREKTKGSGGQNDFCCLRLKEQEERLEFPPSAYRQPKVFGIWDLLLFRAGFQGLGKRGERQGKARVGYKKSCFYFISTYLSYIIIAFII